MSEETPQNLEEAIRDLVNKRQNVLSQEAIDAKKTYELYKSGHYQPEQEMDDEDLRSEIGIFNEHVKILLSVFYKSKFDEFLYLLANPQRMFVVTFLQGIVQGAGFLLGVLFVALSILFVLKETVFLAAIRSIILYFGAGA